MLAVLAAENAVFELQQNHIGAGFVKLARGAKIVGGSVIANRPAHPARVRARFIFPFERNNEGTSHAGVLIDRQRKILP